MNYRKYLKTRYVLIFTLLLAVMLLVRRFFLGFILAAIFAPITFLTVRYSKFVPHVSIETNTASSIFLGYFFGPWVGVLYALGVGGYSYIRNSMVNITFLSTLIMAAIAGAMSGVLHNMGMSFFMCWIIPLLTRAFLATPYFMMFASPFESLTHQTTHFFLNSMIYYQFFKALSLVIVHFV